MNLRMTHATAAVLQAIDAGYRYGFDIVEATGIRGGTVYPILRRLVEAGIAQSRWEEPSIGRREGRPPRRYYRLLPGTADLVEKARTRYPASLGRTEGLEQRI